MSEITRFCEKCRQTMPVRDGKTVIFRKKNKAEYESVCTYCRQILDEMVEHSIEHNQAMIDSLHLSALQQRVNELRKALDSPDSLIRSPNVADVYETTLHYFGGLEMAALQNAATFLKSKPGGPNRRMILANMNALGAKVSQFGFAKKPKHLLTDEELEDLIAEQGKRLLTGPRLAEIDDEEVA